MGSGWGIAISSQSNGFSLCSYGFFPPSLTHAVRTSGVGHASHRRFSYSVCQLETGISPAPTAGLLHASASIPWEVLIPPSIPPTQCSRSWDNVLSQQGLLWRCSEGDEDWENWVLSWKGRCGNAPLCWEPGIRAGWGVQSWWKTATLGWGDDPRSCAMGRRVLVSI